MASQYQDDFIGKPCIDVWRQRQQFSKVNETKQTLEGKQEKYIILWEIWEIFG